MKKSNSIINIKTANSAMLVLLLLGFLSTPFWLLPNNYGISIYTFCIPLLIALLFRKASQEYIKDSRFRAYPSWLNTIILTGLYLAITYGLIISFDAFLSLIFPDMFKTAEKMQTIPFKETSSIFDIVIYVLSITVIAPLYEEFVFRGLALRAYEKKFSPLLASVFIAILFALFHGDLIKFIYMIPGFFILARAVQVFENWWLAVIVHIVNNSIALGINLLIVTNEKAVENSIFLMSPILTGILGFTISLISFLIALLWLGNNQTNVPAFEKNRDKFLSYDLVIFVIMCLMLMFGII